MKYFTFSVVDSVDVVTITVPIKLIPLLMPPAESRSRSNW